MQINVSKMAGLLNNTSILGAITLGRIIIYPFVEKNLNQTSYNVTLGDTIFRQNTAGRPLDLMVPDDVQLLWNRNPEKGEKFIINPGETILAHTREFIGARVNINPSLRGRSTVGRACVGVSTNAGWGDVGYVNRWGLIIHNEGVNAVVLTAGMPIAQMIFMSTEETNSYSGNYQSTENLEDLMNKWKPEDILPAVIKK